MNKMLTAVVSAIIAVVLSACGADEWSAPEPTETTESWLRVQVAASPEFEASIGTLCATLGDKFGSEDSEAKYQTGWDAFNETWPHEMGEPPKEDLWNAIYGRCDLPIYNGGELDLTG